MEAKQATAKTQAETREAALRLEEETREVALQAAVHRSLETKDYEALNVDEVSNKLDGLSATELKKVREYEEHNKNRETLIAEIDRRLSATA
jgi:DNA repair exonuclease SbcCD ATPase subunit